MIPVALIVEAFGTGMGMGGFLAEQYAGQTMFNTVQGVIDRAEARKAQIKQTVLGRMVQAGHAILTRSDYYCPKDTLRLVKSGKVYVRGTDVNPEVEVAYDAPYAVFVHEDITATHASPTRAKFLEIAVEESRGDINRIITDGQAARVSYQI